MTALLFCMLLLGVLSRLDQPSIALVPARVLNGRERERAAWSWAKQGGKTS